MPIDAAAGETRPVITAGGLFEDDANDQRVFFSNSLPIGISLKRNL